MPLIDTANTYKLKIKPNDVPQVETRQNIQNCTSGRLASIDQSKNSPKKKKKENKVFQNQINRLKITISDRQFDLKKLVQDFAEQKKQLSSELNKLKCQSKTLVKESRERLQQQIEYWTGKTQVLEQQHQMKLQEQKQILSQKLEKQRKYIQNTLEQKNKHVIEQLQQQIQNQKNTSLKIVNQLITAQETQIKKIKQLQIKTKSNQQNQFYKLVENMKIEHQNQVNFYQESLKSKDKEIKQLQLIYKDKISNCQDLLIERHKQIGVKNTQLNLISQTIQKLTKQKQDFRLDKVCLQRKLNKMQAQYQQKYDDKISTVNQSLKSKTEQMMNYYLKATEQMENRFNAFSQKSSIKQKLLQERSIQMLSIFKTNKSKEEDLKMIESLQLKLIKKQFELEHQKQELKTCKLQLNNMDKMYQKVFQQAKMKAFKSRKLKLPSLMNRSTMDCYDKSLKDNRKQLKQNVNYMTKDVKQVSNIKYQSVKQIYE